MITEGQESMEAKNTKEPDADAMAEIQALQQGLKKLRDEIGRTIVGQDRVITELLISMLCRGHALLIGVPGLAKTLAVRTISRALALDFNRIQFTPDLMPSDITGTDIIEEDRSTGSRNFRFLKGPLFANIVLADEINRTPPKTQAALLEAMEERQITAGGNTYELPDPFFVLATQNPIEQEGTYPLPEAQLDRFMFNIHVDYPAMNEELEIVKKTTGEGLPAAEAVLSNEEILRLQAIVRQVPAADHVISYALSLARGSRPGKDNEDAFIRDNVAWGAGPRASQFLVAGGKAHAIVNGSYHLSMEDVKEVARAVMRHRIVPSFNAEASGIRTDDIIDHLLAKVTARE
jgi:MoxR-like ATPase